MQNSPECDQLEEEAILPGEQHSSLLLLGDALQQRQIKRARGTAARSLIIIQQAKDRKDLTEAAAERAGQIDSN